jgi:hypothetical protein
MNGFEEYGQAMLLANQGNAQVADAIVAGVKRVAENFRGWLRAMPTTLPPTESLPRK